MDRSACSTRLDGRSNGCGPCRRWPKQEGRSGREWEMISKVFDTPKTSLWLTRRGRQHVFISFSFRLSKEKHVGPFCVFSGILCPLLHLQCCCHCIGYHPACFFLHYVTDWWLSFSLSPSRRRHSWILRQFAPTRRSTPSESHCRHRLLAMGQHDEVLCHRFDDSVSVSLASGSHLSCKKVDFYVHLASSIHWFGICVA